MTIETQSGGESGEVLPSRAEQALQVLEAIEAARVGVVVGCNFDSCGNVTGWFARVNGCAYCDEHLLDALAQAATVLKLQTTGGQES